VSAAKATKRVGGPRMAQAFVLCVPGGPHHNLLVEIAGKSLREQALLEQLGVSPHGELPQRIPSPAAETSFSARPGVLCGKI